MDKKILLGHGSGGKLTRELIENLFVKHFSNEVLDRQSDSAVLDVPSGKMAFTTDSFVVDPIFFPGGDIGKLAIAGTVNDLSVSGAKPLCLSCSFILEEGFPLAELEKIVISMAKEARKAEVSIVTGDTKVVNKGKCDKVFINTSGVGLLNASFQHISTGDYIQPGDKILVNGSLADHGMAILAARNEMNLHADIESDCASLNHLIRKVLEAGVHVKFMRDATRGGAATVLAELAENKPFGLEITESKIKIGENVRGICEILGFDPLYVANEGKVILVVSEEDAGKALEIMQSDELGKQATIIGEIVNQHPGKAWLNTGIGGKRIIDMLAGEQLPRIC
ncbi:MAG: hydrogenase expression/formation protein HypE [Bacteroidales bacterium]|nr:hydrogenase expression/formation protein HypE [Bacteroidales bacterium]MCF8343107.1 hydrogenase expression/formation protein HypE [Bacteroidales bacterium]MCF8349634.1 hydrogenase expression/formation protein HypE [Bacteroidales bacterium]MCF8376075.1 hydrogenase expression/formation protein HypE [Bacteroidales bacterium]MCF8400392.1 hydrogenase expression/formation protein HypE [Bacteroidales bacterium]